MRNKLFERINVEQTLSLEVASYSSYWLSEICYVTTTTFQQIGQSQLFILEFMVVAVIKMSAVIFMRVCSFVYWGLEGRINCPDFSLIFHCSHSHIVDTFTLHFLNWLSVRIMSGGRLLLNSRFRELSRLRYVIIPSTESILQCLYWWSLVIRTTDELESIILDYVLIDKRHSWHPQISFR